MPARDLTAPRINSRLYASLLVMGLCPALYSALRIYFLGQMPDASAYSIAGQLGWLNLIYEVVQEAILLPLYFFLGQVAADRAAFANRVRSGLLLSTGFYTALAAVIWIWAKPLLQWMAASPDILDASAAYIRIESVANIFGALSSFTLVALVTLGREKYLYLFTAARLVLSVVSDSLLISSLPAHFFSPLLPSAWGQRDWLFQHPGEWAALCGGARSAGQGGYSYHGRR